jgi:glycerol dehydrogenase
VESIFVSPLKYTQGPGLINKIGEYASNYGQRCIVVADEFVFELIKEPLVNSLNNSKIQTEFICFGGECSYSEIERISENAKKFEADMVLAAGGGKSLDTGKAVAFKTGSSIIIVPTIAATDSPTSSIAVVYSDDHIYEGVMRFPQNPCLVLVDTEIISKAPSRFIVAGMGDALATKFEAQACFKSRAKNLHGGNATLAGLAVADLCYEIIMNHGIAAKWAADNKVVTPSLEKVVEANILLSGLGFENGGEAAAHAFDGAITILPSSQSAYHGERVAVGVLIQMILEDHSLSELSKHIQFYKTTGLPCSLDALGVIDISSEDLKKVAARMCRPGSHIHNMPFKVTEKMIIDAIQFLKELSNRL